MNIIYIGYASHLALAQAKLSNYSKHEPPYWHFIDDES